MTHVHLGTQIHLDTRFGIGGFAITTPSAVDGLEFASVGLVQVTGGKLVAGGTGVRGQTEHFYLAGYDSDGHVDRSFGRTAKSRARSRRPGRRSRCSRRRNPFAAYRSRTVRRWC